MKGHRLYLMSGLTILILFQHCAPIQYYQNDILYFTEIPLKQQRQDYTRLYFPDDLKPERPYIEAGLVRLVVKGNKGTRQMAEPLRAKAQRLGLDAVILIQRSNEGVRGANFGEALALGAVDGMVNGIVGQDAGVSSVDGFETYAYSVLEGVGIKYLDNIRDIEKSVKSEKVYVADDPGKLLYKKSFFLNGETESIDFDDQIAIHIHDNFVEAFSLHHLINQQANWGYKTYGNTVMNRIHYKTPDWKIKNARFIYDGQHASTLRKIVIRYTGKERRDVIKLYRKLGVVEMKAIYQGAMLSFKEKLEYDDKDRLVTRKIFKMNDGVETLWLIADYDYYKNSELQKYLKKAEDKPGNE